MIGEEQQRGSATVLGVAAVGFVITVGMALVATLSAVSVRFETETAADAAALAAIVAAVDGANPRRAAEDAATGNGARLVRCECPAFVGRSFRASVLVTRAIRVPVIGDLLIRSERAAEYSVDP